MARLTLISLCVLVLAGTSIARADESSATAFFKSVHLLSQPPIAQHMLNAVMTNPAEYSGRAIEVSGTVTGQVAAGSDRTILVSVDGTIVNAVLPETLNQAMWIGVGANIRALFSIKASINSPFDLSLIAAAPEADVSTVEAREARIAASRQLTSRFMSYSRDQQGGYSREQQGGAVAPMPVYYDNDGGHPDYNRLSARAVAIFGPYHNAVHHFNKRLSPEEVDEITNSILENADTQDIDPRLLVAMIIAESDFDIFSRSNKGAMGIGQIMPDEARRYGVEDPYDVRENIRVAASILRGHLEKYGGAPQQAGVIPEDQLKLIMAAYNAGPGAVHKYHGVPPYRETQNYVRKVAILYKEMCAEQ